MCWFRCLLAMLLAATLGCDKAKEAIGTVGDAAKKAGSSISKQAGDASQQVAGKVGEMAKQTSDMATQAAASIRSQGSMSLELSGELTLDACYASFVPSVGGRKALLQLRTYPSPEPRGYPSVFVHLPVDASNVQELAGQKVEARVFVQDADGVIWDNVDQPLASLRIESVQDKEVAIRFEAGELRNANTRSVASLSGTAVAVLSQ